MATLTNVLILLAVSVVCNASNVFDRVLDDVDTCRETCRNSYAAHTYENGNEAESCNRGCRFYSIMAFIHDHEENATVKDCVGSCTEAYNGSTTNEIAACVDGCHSQAQAWHLQKPAAEEPETEAGLPVHVLYPLMYMHSMYSSMLDQVYHHMEVSWSFIMHTSDGRLVVVHTQPQVSDFGPEDSEDIPDSLPWPDDKTISFMETNIVSQDNSATPLLNFGASQLRAARSDDGLQLNAEDVSRSDWLTCVARKTGIARIILCFLILATAVVMIWICLTAAATAPEQRLSINGDLEYLRAVGEKDGFKLLHPQSVVEARPLPVKIRVEQI